MITRIPLRLAVSSDDRVTIDNVAFRVIETRPSFLLARADSPREITQLTSEEFDAFSETDRFSIERDFYGLRAARGRQLASTTSIIHLEANDQAQILHRLDWCDRFLTLEASTCHLPVAERITRSDAKLTTAIAMIEDDLAKKSRITPKRSDVACSPTTYKAPVPRTLRKWLLLYELADFDPLALRDQRFRSGDRSLRCHPEVHALMVKHRRAYLNPRQPMLKDVYYDLAQDIAALNATRRQACKASFPVPCQDSFSKFIQAMGEFEIYAGRNGLEAARKKYYVSGQGQLITQIGQIVEMDEWTIQLHKLLIEADIYDSFSEDERQLIEKTRWSLSMAEDAATRVVVGMRLAPTANARTALSTLAMIFEDKSAYADAAGCQTAWRYRTGIGLLRTDNGSAYVDSRFRLAVTAVQATADRTPAGRPQLRGRIERLFSTIAKGLTTLFEGRTFANVVAGAHYPSDQRAVLTVEELGQAIVRFVMDIYHHTPHSGLGGETPNEAWERLERASGVIPLPDRNTRRSVFGRKVTRRITTYGVEVAGLHYQSDRLQEHRRKHGDGAKVEVSLDLHDLGHVSVRFDEGWIGVKCLDDSVAGVSFERYATIARQVEQARVENRTNLKEIVDAARRSLREMNRMAVDRAGIASLELSDAALERALKEFKIGLGAVSTDQDAAPTTATPGDLLSGGFEVPGSASITDADSTGGISSGDDFDLEDMS